MIQKIIKVGNSVAVTLPNTFIQDTGLKAGDTIAVETYPQRKMVLIKPTSEKNQMSLSPEFFSWLEKISKKYEKTIKALARV
ncbi:AbrB/MazE/SpoVT family DNA-binding domain-containing protein [Candidatus Gottesmanbacteria bacterium]|nr:AbrB/MazE/SpoVT family DNA-binding domain-containing protein [Candidatus Gottesmanbacteria bacterium]